MRNTFVIWCLTKHVIVYDNRMSLRDPNADLRLRQSGDTNQIYPIFSMKS